MLLMGHLHTSVIYLKADIQIYYNDILELFLKYDVIHFVIYFYPQWILGEMVGGK